MALSDKMSSQDFIPYPQDLNLTGPNTMTGMRLLSLDQERKKSVNFSDLCSLIKEYLSRLRVEKSDRQLLP